MWILTETDAILNTDNITYMDVEETEDDVFIKAYFTVSSASVWSDRIYTDYYKFCILDNTENNKNTVKRIFNEIFDSMYSEKKTFNIPKRLGRV
jgi:hypothetical protein